MYDVLPPRRGRKGGPFKDLKKKLSFAATNRKLEMDDEAEGFRTNVIFQNWIELTKLILNETATFYEYEVRGVIS